MRDLYAASRRDFLRRAIGALALGPGLYGQRANLVAETSQTSPEAVLVARLKLDREICEANSVLNGEIYFRTPPNGEVLVRWVDSTGRAAEEITLPAPASAAEPQHFSFRLSNGLTYVNWVEVIVNGVRQAEGAKFLLSPKPAPWDDFHAIVWASYPDGFYDLLSGVGIDSTIAYHDNDFSHVLDNNFRLYVEQMAPDIFSLYHKRQELWRSLIAQFQNDRENWKLLIRKPCVNDPKTDEVLHDRLTRIVRQHRPFRPLYYNIADELGHGDQIKPIDFCHGPYCTAKFAQYLRELYGTTDRVAAEWGGGEAGRWDDEVLSSGSDWEHGDLMIARTTTDQAFDSIAVASLHLRYGGTARFNKEWSTSFPEPVSEGNSSLEQWEPMIGLVREARSAASVDERSLEQKLGPLDAANVRWGRRGGWTTDGKSVGFKSWPEVAAFLKRFYAALGEIRSTEGWNVAPWCDFRNFMDWTFASAVQRAGAVCKAEDPEARCATEGGQVPAAFGWYNYEQVVKAVDVIEPYNEGNNVEILRSLKPEVILLATHGFGHHPGKPLTPHDLVAQRAVGRALWWGLFHNHRAAIIWDNNEPNFEVVDLKTRQPTASADAFRDTFKELHGGIAKLIINSRRPHDGIAIHYSHPSLQVHWLFENLKNARDWPVHHVSERDSRFIGVRNSWTKLIEDLGFQYEFASREQIESGKLGSGEYRVLIMPESVAISEREENEIREFVRAGGTLLADFRAARMNEHGRDLGRGQLDDVFGIGRASGQTVASTVQGVANMESLQLKGRTLKLIGVGEPGITVAGGKPLARSGNVPAVILNRFGDGRSFFLNLDVSGYAYQRLQTGLDPSLPELMEGILSLAQVRPRVSVLAPDGKRLPGTEVAVFSNGSCEHLAVFRNPQFDDGGWGDNPTIKAGDWTGEIDNSLLEKPAEVRIEWPEARQTYDVRERKDLGHVQSHQKILDPWSPLIFTRAAQPLPNLHVELPTDARAGRPLAVKLASEGAFPEGAVRVVRVELLNPAGVSYHLYGRNLLMRASPVVERIPTAYNDPKGRWRLRAHDLMTGQEIETAFDLA